MTKASPGQNRTTLWSYSKNEVNEAESFSTFDDKDRAPDAFYKTDVEHSNSCCSTLWEWEALPSVQGV
jgi:hypothetical protein